MNASQQKIVQCLHQARGREDALAGVLQSRIAMTPRSSYRSALDTHLKQTRNHASRVGGRLDALGHGSRPAQHDVDLTFASPTYTEIEQLARSAGDEETAVMASSILADKEMMLERIMREIPKLTDAVVLADVTATSGGDAIREARADVRSRATAAGKRGPRQAREAAGVAR